MNGPMPGVTDAQIRNVLNKCKKNVREAAGVLKVGLSTMYRRLEIMGENRPLRKRVEKAASTVVAKVTGRKRAAPQTNAVKTAAAKKTAKNRNLKNAPLNLDKKCAAFIASISPEINTFGRKNVMDYCVGTFMRHSADWASDN